MGDLGLPAGALDAGKLHQPSTAYAVPGADTGERQIERFLHVSVSAEKCR
jgi:hypothetical protein